MRKFLLLILMAFMIFSIELRADVPAGPNPEESMIQLFEEESDQIVVSQMPFDLNLPSFGIGSSMNEDLTPLLRPPFIQEYFDRIGEGAPFHSSKVIEGVDIKIPEGVSFHINPNLKKPVEAWTAKLIDSRGAVVKELKGEGNPPQTIQWDGTEEGWIRIQAGEAYNFVYDGVNKDGSHVHEVGTPTKFPYFSILQNKSFMMIIAGPELFKGQGVAALSETGRSLLLAVCENITKFPGQPIVIDVDATEHNRAQKEAKVIQEFVSDVLIKSPEELTTDIQVDPNERDQIKVQVLGVEK